MFHYLFFGLSMPDYIPLKIALKKAEEFSCYYNDVYNLIKNNKLDIYCYYDGYLGEIYNYSIDRSDFELELIRFKKHKGELKILLRDNILKFLAKVMSNTKLENRVLIDYVSISENGSYLEYCIANLKPESYKINLPCKFSLIANKRLDGLWLDISGLLVDKDQFMNILSEEKSLSRELEILRSKYERFEKENNTLKEAQNLSDIYNHPAFNEKSPTYAPEMRKCMELWDFIYKNGKPKLSHEQLANKFLNERDIGSITVDAEGKIIKESNDRLRLKRVTNINKR